jgi:S-adenosylmethionine hydrolase
MNSKIVALLTDFGGRDAYVGVMKAVILGRDPTIKIIDLTHQIDAHDLLSAAYVLYSAWEYFPKETVFCAVVDPGVGSNRGTLVARFDQRYLIAPDNGLVSLLKRMIPDGRVHTLRADQIKTNQSSSTFDGRDLFAPAAADLLQGGIEGIGGSRIEPVLLPSVIPQLAHEGLVGTILHIDRFGNSISSIHRSDLESFETQHGEAADFTVHSGRFRRRGFCNTYADVPVGEPLCLIGSSGFLELAVHQGNAAKRFDLRTGHTLTVTAEAS